METDDYLEVQKNREVIDSLQQKLEDLERINLDLEYRLGNCLCIAQFELSPCNVTVFSIYRGSSSFMHGS